MAPKKEYRSAVRSRRLIREAFLQLLQEKELRKITVTDIVNRADINRTTFYAHYPDVRGVVEEIENEIIEEMQGALQECEGQDFFRDPTPILGKASRHMEENRELYTIFMQEDDMDRLMKWVQDILEQYMKQNTVIPQAIRRSQIFSVRMHFFAGGIANVYRKWLCGELDCPLGDAYADIGEILKQSAREFYEQAPATGEGYGQTQGKRERTEAVKGGAETQGKV